MHGLEELIGGFVGVRSCRILTLVTRIERHVKLKQIILWCESNIPETPPVFRDNQCLVF